MPKIKVNVVNEAETAPTESEGEQRIKEIKAVIENINCSKENCQVEVFEMWQNGGK